MSYHSRNAGLALACLLLWLCGNTAVAQSVDSSFTPPVVYRAGEVFLMKKAPKDKVYIAGDFDYHGERHIGHLVRLTPSGFLDTSFNPDLPEQGKVIDFDVLPNGNVATIVRDDAKNQSEIFVLAVNGRRIKKIQHYKDPLSICALPDNRFLIGYRSGGLVMITRNLNLDKTFRYSSRFADGTIADIQLQGTQVILSGWFNHIYDSVENTSVMRHSMARINYDGTIDASFIVDNYEIPGIPAFHVQPNGKIIPTNGYADTTSVKPMRLHDDGSRDGSFVYSGELSIKDACTENGLITLLTKDKIVRVRDDGAIDPAFTPIPLDVGNSRMVVLPDQTILVANQDRSQFGLAKFNSAGELVEGYKAQLLRYGIINSIDQFGESLFIGGDFIKVNKHFTRNVARLSLNGKVDEGFSVPANYGAVSQLGCLDNGKVLVRASKNFYRVRENGDIDPTFSFEAAQKFSPVREFVLQDKGKILIGAPGGIYRLDSTGTVDASFKTAIRMCCEDARSNFDLEKDKESGKIFVGGLLDTLKDARARNLVRMNSQGKIDTAFTYKNPDSFFGIVKVLSLNQDQVLISSQDKHRVGENSFYVVKLDEHGVPVEKFLSNYQAHTREDSRRAYDLLHQFNGNLILGANDQRSGFVGQIIHDDGTVATDFSFSKNIRLHCVNTFFSENDLELYIAGQITVGSSETKSQLVKILNDNPGVLAIRPEKK